MNKSFKILLRKSGLIKQLLMGITLVFFIITITNVYAASTSLTLTDDSWVNNAAPATNYGQNAVMYTHQWGPRRSLVKFDTGSINGEVVDSAILKFHVSSAKNSGIIKIHMITSAWQEENVNWINMPTFEVLPVASFGISASDTLSTIEIDMTAATRKWSNGDVENFGFMMITSDNIAATFLTKDFTADPLRAPTLEVTTSSSIPVSTVMDLSTLPYVIDQPGFYTLDRNWKLSRDNEDLFSFIQVNTDKVTIDLMGHELAVSGVVPIYGIDINASGVMVRNGTIKVTHSISCDGSAILGQGNDIRVLNMLLLGYSECPTIGGAKLTGIEHQVVRVSTTHELCNPMVEDCKIDRGGSVVVGDFSIAKDNHIFCDGEFCLEAGSNSIVTNNTVSDKIRVVSDNLVVNNISRGIEETGTGNTVESNWNR